MSDGLFIFGAGGHAKVVVSSVLASGLKIEGIIDDDPGRSGTSILGFRVDLSGNYGDFAGRRGVIAIGSNQARQKLAERIPGIQWEVVVHPRAYVDPSVVLGPGTVVFAGAVIQPEAVIGKHCIINTHAVIDHDCIIGDYCHIAPGSRLAGNVSVGNGSFMGLGSIALPGVSIGNWSVIGAGGVVIADIPDNVIAAGVPARIIGKH